MADLENQPQPLPTEAFKDLVNETSDADGMADGEAGQIDTVQQDIDNDLVDYKSSRLLSLPEKLRLRIWKLVLTNDAAPGSLVLRIKRDDLKYPAGKRFANSLYKHPISREIETSFENRPSSPIGVTLLRANHLIYAEALPILYRAVSFCPFHLEGIFPLFLENLSAFAKANIRYITLNVTTDRLPTRGMFYWALTCAQIARLNHEQTLRNVSLVIKGNLTHNEAYFKRAVLAPLLKIKAPKLCHGSDDAKLQILLVEAAVEREERAVLRQTAMEADPLEQVKPDYVSYPVHHGPPQKKQRLAIRGKQPKAIYSSVIDEGEIVRELAEVPGTEHPEDDLEWDFINTREESASASSTTTETASYVYSSHSESDEEESDADEWELVDKPLDEVEKT
jgi:hypothetical protein